MPTIKTRINITADKETEQALRRIAKRDRVPMATKVVELLHLALELEEDLLLGQIIDQRAADKKARFVSHERAWA